MIDVRGQPKWVRDNTASPCRAARGGDEFDYELLAYGDSGEGNPGTDIC